MELLDLEGKLLEKGVIYLISGRTTTEMVIAKFSHETAMSFIFDAIDNKNEHPNLNLSGVGLYTYKRNYPKWGIGRSILAIRASDDILNRYGLV